MIKTICFSFALMIFSLVGNAQSDKYVAAMTKNLSMVDSSMRSTASMLSLSNSMLRIAEAEKTQWLPYYYASLFKVNSAFIGGNFTDADPVADDAMKLAEKAEALSAGNAEIHVLKAMISTLRMLVAPQQRFMSEGENIQKLLQTAISLDSKNPRPYYLLAENLKNTPEQFGGGCEPAKEFLMQAMKNFGEFMPASDIAPNWGRERTEALVKECGF